ncbi:axoneme-associated protein mst101(2) isoform X2 [Chanodichthys erythropterus]|uniref:axoneme-associated protein mst101(2) isoform X2 n=1 Tax=Chanodichthys erythropterus TaxID=933992 RepID=UPI00351F5F85
MSQVKAKKKLHYYQKQEIAHSELSDVFPLRGIDTLFDDIDADSELGLPLPSPFPKSTLVNGQKKSSHYPEKMKASSKQVHKDTLIQENGIQEDEIIDRETPFKEIVPIKTSSPIALAMERDESVDGVRSVAYPLLFGDEEEEPIGGDFSKVSCIQQSKPAKDSLYGDSGSLVSPPERLEFRKTAKTNAGSLSSMKLAKNTKTSVEATQSSPPEMKKDLTMDKDPGQLSPVLVRKSQPKLREEEQCKSQVMEDQGKGLSFQQKPKKALMPKSPCSRKQAAVPAPPPVDLEEDFIILDDEAPVHFIIPRKPEVKNKRPVPADTAKEKVLTEPHSTDQLSQSEVEMTDQHEADAKRNKAQIESGKQKMKGKFGKASKKSGKDSVTGREDGADCVTEALEDNDCDQTSSQTKQGHKEVQAETPFKEIVPIKTSSPIALAMERDESVDGVRSVADPLLFGDEEEEPIGGDFSKVSCTQQSKPAKDSLYGDSGSLVSPPERLEFRKTAKSNAGSLSSMKLAKNTKTSVEAIQSSPPEMKKDLTMDKDPGQLSPVLVQKSEPKLQEEEQCKNQVTEDQGKGLSFQQKLKKALMPKSPWKQAAVPAPPPVDLEEDFIILDDEAPVLFIIPRKPEVKNKRPVPADTAKEKVLTEPHSTDQLSQSEVEMTDQHEADAKRNKAQIESGKQKMKGKFGKASKKSGKNSVTGREDGADRVTEALEDNDCDQTSSQTKQGHKEVQAVTGKKRAKSKAPEPVQLSDKDETDAGCSQEIPAPVYRTTKKSSKSSKQERPESNEKRESYKVTSAAALHSTNSVKFNKNRKNKKKEETVSKTKKQTSKKQIELEQIDPSCDEQEHDPPLALEEQEEEQRTAVNKQSSTKEDAMGPGKKLKRKTQMGEPKPKDPPTTASDISSDSPLCFKRKRKPPGAWWLTSPNESTTELQPKQLLVAAQGPKASTKTPTKQAAAVDSEETQSLKPAKGKQKKSKTPNVLDDGKKLIAVGDRYDTGAEQKTAKKTGGRRKPKSAAIPPQVASPVHVLGEEVEACPNESAGEISPEFCSPKRQHNVLPGEKRVFDQVYSKDVGSSQKPPSSSLRRPDSSASDNFPQKRQRKAPSNWWEAPLSQEPADGLSPPHSSPPKKSKLSNTPLRGVFNKEGSSMKLQKTKNHTRNIKRNIINTPKSIKRSLASMNAIFASEKPENMVKSGQRCRKQGRRNLLHSLEDQSDHSSENLAQSDDQLQGNRRSSFGFTSGITVHPPGTRNKTSVRVSSGPNTLSDVDAAFRSGPSSMLELQQRDEEDDDIDLPSSRVTPHVRQAPRVFAHCDLCGPPLEPVVLEDEDWNNLHAWFSHLWHPASKNGRVISPDDFHWHSHGGRAMGHAVDLQSYSFSHGKILLGSYMKKPSHVDHDMVSVFSIISSCVRVDIEGVKSVYNSGEVFMIPSGQAYSILNLCQEPAVLIYHRTQSNDTPT